MAMKLSSDLERWRAAGHTFLHRGLPVFYRVEGSGPALLAIHGFPSASYDFAPIWGELTKHFRVIAPDMLGFGFSAKPRGYPYSVVKQTDLHEALLAELGVPHAHVLAHDYGVSVAQELLARQAIHAVNTVGSVCFLNGGIFPERHRPRRIQTLVAGPLGGVLQRLGGKGSFRRGLCSVFGPATQPSPQFLEELYALLRHNDGQLALHNLLDYMRERREQRERWVGAVKRTDVPLRLIDGVLDPVSGAHLAAYYREQVPEADVVELNVGHYPHVEDPASVLAAFLTFQRRIGTLS